jgi:hypothetical protein
MATEFSVISVTGGASVPFSLGYAFREGDVPSGSTVLSDVAEFQCVAKNAWPDGSLKFAILSGRAALTAGQWRTLALRSGAAPAARPPVSLADLRATGIAASVTFGAYGAASWTGTDWDAPFQTWVSGPEMSSWVYRKPIGGDAHLVAWLEVRCFAGGAVEVLPWIENGYLRVSGATSKSGAVSFTLGGTERYGASLTLLNHQRAVLASGTTFAHWLGTDPQTSVRHNTPYMMASRMVPNYRGVTSSGSSSLNNVATSYQPLAQADYSPMMNQTGYQKAIGLLPHWDALYLTSGGDARAWRAVQVNAYCAGRYGFHHRDETTNRPLRLSAYPTLELGSGLNIEDIGDDGGPKTPASGGGAPPLMDTAHLPAMAYFAYLVTGRMYFLEEVQLLSTTCYLKVGRTVRQGASYIINGSSASVDESRGAAWTLRTLTHAASVTPDGDVLQGEFRNAINANIDWYHARYVGKGNPGGHVLGYGDQGEPGHVQRCWMDDFVTMAWGFLKDQKVNAADRQTRLDQFCAYKYQAIVGRLGPGTPGTYNYRYAAQYDITTAPTNSTDWAGGTGPWYANWGAIAAAWGVPAADGGTALMGTSGSSPDAMGTGYWGNLHPAIAYAVDHGAPGARDAYNRLTNASNYAANATQFNSSPEWGVQPRS